MGRVGRRRGDAQQEVNVSMDSVYVNVFYIRKRKRFTIKAPPVYKRRDENNKILIINTEKDDKLRSHQVSHVPFPFTSVSDFEVYSIFTFPQPSSSSIQHCLTHPRPASGLLSAPPSFLALRISR